jgi:hypothetical protein
MADSGDRYAPFESGTIDKYKAVLRNMKSDRASKVDVTTVQQALLALQDKSLVWKESRGVYALEDASIIDLLRSQGPSPKRTAPHEAPIPSAQYRTISNSATASKD